MKNISPAEKTVGLFLAHGFTKKEIANKLNKSERTIGRQADDLYKKTGSRNLADITRFIVRRYTGIAVEDVIINALRDLTILVFGIFLFEAVAANTEELKAAIQELATSFVNFFNY